MAEQWTLDSLRTQGPDTIPVSLNGTLVDAQILKREDQVETTIRIGDNLFGTTWHEILAALNAGRPLEISPNPDHMQMRD